MKSFYFVIFIIISITLIYHFIYDYDTDDDEDEKKQTKKYKDYIKTTHSGFIRGVLMGCIFSWDLGISAIIMNGAVFGVINPMMMHMGY
jgi:membrane associated rhomboid family serine protease